MKNRSKVIESHRKVKEKPSKVDLSRSKVKDRPIVNRTSIKNDRFQKLLVSETMVLRGLGEKYGDRVGRESIDEGIRGVQGSKNHRKRAENRPNTFPKNPKFGHVLLLAL